MKKTLNILLLLCSLAAAPVHAQLIFGDSLAYPDGNIVNNSGGLWIRHSGTSSDSLVVNGRYEINQSHQDDVHRWFDPVNTNGFSSGVLYASFTLKMTNLPANPAGAYFAHFMDTGTLFRGRVYALTTNALPGAYRLGVANAAGDGSPNQVFPQDLALNTDYQVVLAYDIDNAYATLWVNPASESDPNTGGTSDLGGVTNALAAFAFRQAAGEGVMQIANLLVGQSFADVVTNTPAIPVIGLQPVSVTNVAGYAASLTVLASGQGVLSYQWMHDGSPVPGGTDSTLAFPSLSGADQGEYYCVVANTAGFTNSATAYVSVDTTPIPPTFTQQPVGATKAVGTSITFTAAVYGTGPFSYQWYLNGTPLVDGPTASGSVVSGATTVSLTVSGITAGDAGTYTLAVTGGAGSATSSGAVLTLLPPYLRISSGNYSENFDSLANSGTVNNWVDAGTLAGWYASQSTAPLIVTNYQASAGTLTTGAIYSFGSASSTDRALGSIGSNNSGHQAYGVLFTNDTAQIATNFVIGYTGEQWRNGGNAAAQKLTFSYRISSTPITGSQANTTAGWTGVSALDFTTPIVGSTGAALDGNAAANRQVISGVVLAGVQVLPGQEIFFRWYDANDSGNDHAVALDDLSISFSTVNPPGTAPAITSQPQSRTNNYNTTASFTATASGALPLTYQWYAGTSPLSDDGRIVGASTASLTISNVSAADASGYWVVAANSFGSATSSVAQLTVNDPAFTSQPAGGTNVAGDNLNLFFNGIGTPPLSYQWYSNGVPIAGAIGNALNFTLPPGSVSADYYAVATGANGSTTSSVARVEVLPTPSTKLATWDFNSNPSDGSTTTGSTEPSLGAGTVTLVGGVSSAFVPGTFADPASLGNDNTGWNTSAYPAASTGNKTAGIQFNLSTVGYKNVLVTWQQRNSNTASKYARVQYTTDGVNFLDHTVVNMTDTNNNFMFFSSDLSGLPGVNDNPNFAFRIVSEFESTATGAGAAAYVATAPSGSYGTGGTMRYDWVNIFADPDSVITPIPLHLQVIDSQAVLTWSDPAFALQAAPDATGVYTNVPGATSPYTNAITAPRLFYRLKH